MAITKDAEAFETGADYHDLDSTREWSTGLCSCIPCYNSEHARSDCRICCLGCFAPCVLFGSNMVRLSGNQSKYCNNCCCYASLLILRGVSRQSRHGPADPKFEHNSAFRAELKEAREIRRRLPLSSPESSSESGVVVAPPSMQAMNRRLPAEAFYVGEKEPESNKDLKLEMKPVSKDAEGFESEADFLALESTREWSTGLCSCIPGSNSEHTLSDCEMCCIDTSAPCVLYGGNVVRLSGNQNDFFNHGLCYASLIIFGKLFLRINVLAPIKTWSSRSAIRTRFGLQSGAERVTSDPSDGCHWCCDCFLHFICHRCALCQEAREIRRRLPPLSGPSSSSGPGVIVAPPSVQAMNH